MPPPGDGFGEPLPDRRVTVLVVDDDPNARLVIEELLADPSRDLRFACSGREGLRELRRCTPAVLLLDINLGDMSGFELASLVRSNERLASTPIVFITGQPAGDEGLTAAYRLGAVDYLAKPIIPAILQSKVTALCTLALQVQEIKWQRDQLATMRRALADANAKLEELAARDVLTGLWNRRHFLLMLDDLRERQLKTGNAHALLMLDLDGFKSVNDTYGHAAGDDVLRTTAARLRHSLRPQDIVARLGGDEFCVAIIDLADTQDLRRILDRLEPDLNAPYDVAGGIRVSCPASVGAVVFGPEADATTNAVLAQADAAMYRAKKAGGGAIIESVEIP